MWLTAPWISGDPVTGAGSQVTPSNLSSTFEANRPEVSVWSSASTLIPKRPSGAIWGHVVDDRATQKPTRGGSSEMEKNEPMARPTARSSSRAATTVTPGREVSEDPPEKCRIDLDLGLGDR